MRHDIADQDTERYLAYVAKQAKKERDAKAAIGRAKKAWLASYTVDY